MAKQENLLQSFTSCNFEPAKGEEDDDEGEELELSLGLSLNGRFGVDPKAIKLTRSSSIPDFTNPSREYGYSCVEPMMASNSSNLVRACSLPAETEEWRKRKDIQTLRRMEAKRKRSEKQRNLKCLKDKSHKGFGGEESCVEGVEKCPASALVPPLSRASIESQGSGSSVISESETQPSVHGAYNSCDERSHASTEQSASTVVCSNGAKEMARNVLEEMPCVFTKGEGPNGKKIQGFLYGYKKGEEVRIVCVCHGSFLSPAEFVKHAGGRDVAHPLRHIVVSASPLF